LPKFIETISKSWLDAPASPKRLEDICLHWYVWYLH
jgi:hypothetical protein